MRPIMVTHMFRGGLMAVCFCALVGCESKPEESEKPAASASAAAAIPTPIPTPVPTPEEAPKVKKKTLADCKEGPVVDFDGDAALEAAVRLKLQKEKGDVKVSELGRVKSLNLSQSKVSQLDPCIYPHMKNLKDLFLGAGSLDDLSPIEGLTQLEALRASLNKVRDLKPLAGLTKMDRLDLGHTQVSDLSPLAGMTALTDLQLDDTPVQDLAPLAKLEKLERLSIQRTNVKSVAPIKGLKNLKFIYTSGAPVDDIFELAPMKRNGLKIIEE
jgi:internalin A